MNLCKYQHKLFCTWCGNNLCKRSSRIITWIPHHLWRYRKFKNF